MRGNPSRRIDGGVEEYQTHFLRKVRCRGGGHLENILGGGPVLREKTGGGFYYKEETFEEL